MKCKKCKREIPDNSMFCCWCGEKQLKTKGEVKIPKPTKLKSGEYSAQIMVDGKRIRVTGKTEAEYRAKVIATREHLIEAKSKPLSVSEAIDKYIDSRSEVLSVSTIRGYRTIQKSHFTEVSDIANSDWQRLVNDESKEYSPKTMKNAWRLISSVLRDNNIPVPNVVLPQQIPHERQFLQPEEIKDYLTKIKGLECEVAALLALHSLRQSELLALTWNDVDLASGTLSVNGAMVPDEHHHYVAKAETKNLSSRRSIPIMIPRLTEILNGVPSKERVGNIVKLHPSSIRRQLVKVNSDITLHSLRHTCCSLGYSLGLTELQLMKIGGWSSPATMRKIYTHLDDASRTKANDKLLNFYLQN